MAMAGSRNPMTDKTLPDWRSEAACVGTDPELFFPFEAGAVSAKQANQARLICARCQVRVQCLKFAMDVPEAHGIWGGTTPSERLRKRRRDRERSRRPIRRAASDLAASDLAASDLAASR
jgi:WhiB family transcriptional regulator, redox-sensing transcriptional regulator